jgi:hypothetical protein
VQKKSLTIYNKESSFRKSFNMLQALAFLPEDDVIFGFDYLKSQINENFKDILKYVEKNYIGKLKIGKDGEVTRANPRFPINSWNLHERVLKNLPRTNNSVESWHGSYSDTIKKGMTVDKVVQAFRKEQNNTEAFIVQIKTGTEIIRKARSIEQDKKIFQLVSNYSSNSMGEFITNISLIMSVKNKKNILV